MRNALLFTLLAATLSLTGAAMANGPKHCPPGLAKKSPACVPPGQAKKGVRYEDNRDDAFEDEQVTEDLYDDRYDRIRVGDRVVLEGEEYTVVRSEDGRVVLRRNDTLYRLPTVGDGSEYVRMGDVLVRVDPTTRAIVEWIRLTDLIFG